MSFLRWCTLSFIMVFFLAATPLKAEPLFGYPEGRGDDIKLENVMRLLGAVQTLKDSEESETFVLRTIGKFGEFVQHFSLKKADNPGVDQCLESIFKAVFQAEAEAKAAVAKAAVAKTAAAELKAKAVIAAKFAVEEATVVAKAAEEIAELKAAAALKEAEESEEVAAEIAEDQSLLTLNHAHIKNILQRCGDFKVSTAEDCVSCTLEIMGHSIKLTLNVISEKQPFDLAAEAQIIKQSFDDLISGHALYEESMACMVGLFKDITEGEDNEKDEGDSEDQIKAKADTKFSNCTLRISQSSGDIQFYRDQFVSASEKFSEETLKSVMTPEEWATFLYSILINKNLSEVLEEYLVTKLEMMSGVEFAEESEEVSFDIGSDSEGL